MAKSRIFCYRSIERPARGDRGNQLTPVADDAGIGFRGLMQLFTNSSIYISTSPCFTLQALRLHSSHEHRLTMLSTTRDGIAGQV